MAEHLPEVKPDCCLVANLALVVKKDLGSKKLVSLLHLVR